MPEDRSEARQVGFGPYESLRSLTDAGMQGVRDASRVFGGFVSMLEQGLAGFTPPRTDGAEAGARTSAGGPGADEVPFADARALIARLGDVYLNIVLRTLEASFDAVTTRARETGPRLSGTDHDGVILEAVPNGPAIGDLYVHNHDDGASQRLNLLVTDLVSVSGDVVPASTITFEPAAVEPVDGGGTVRIRVSIPIAPGPAVYHGTILVLELPEDSVRLRLVVRCEDDARTDEP